MRIVFMGTPEFAVPSLKACLAFPDAQIVGVFTQPDRPKGRGNKLTPPPVKVAALEAGLQVFQPERIKAPEAYSQLTALAPDLIVVVAYGQLLNQDILSLPKYGCINVHASLLPKLRGASPIQWSIVSGERFTGVTTMKMSLGLDEGEMLVRESVEITETMTGGELHDRLMALGAKVLTKTLEECLEGVLRPVPQDHALATYAPKIEKKMSEIDWRWPADRISAMVRGFDPWPAAVTTLGNLKLKLFQPQVVETGTSDLGDLAAPGTLLEVTRDSFTVKAGENAVKFYEIQAPGSRRMAVKAYLLGHALEEGDCFGSVEAQ